MRLTLAPYPDTPSTAVAALQADVARSRSGALALRFVLTGDLSAIALPASAATPTRTDDLWRHTCFEAFVGAEGAFPYAEVNLSPSGDWAVYAFDHYREGMRAPSGIVSPKITVRRDAAELVLEAELDLSAVGELPGAETWRFGLSAVIEEASGAKSYWALEHAPGKPDFHHPDCFAARLRAPEAP